MRSSAATTTQTTLRTNQAMSCHLPGKDRTMPARTGPVRPESQRYAGRRQEAELPGRMLTRRDSAATSRSSSPGRPIALPTPTAAAPASR